MNQMTKIYEKTRPSLQLSTTNIGNITNESDIYNKVDNWFSLFTVKMGQTFYLLLVPCYFLPITYYVLAYTLAFLSLLF